MKNPMNQVRLFTVSLLLSAGLVTQFSSCGLGTEIGNGFKPGGSDSSGGTAEGKKVANAASDTPTTDASQEAPGSSTATPIVTSNEGGAASSADKAPDGTFMLALLYSSCATPFADVTPAGKTLVFVPRVPGATQQFSAEYLAAGDGRNAMWNLRTIDQLTFAMVEPDAASGAHHAKILDIKAAPIADRYTCKSVKEADVDKDADGLVAGDHQVTVEFANASSNDAAGVVTWTLDHDKVQLLRIDVTPPGADKISLEAQ